MNWQQSQVQRSSGCLGGAVSPESDWICSYVLNTESGWASNWWSPCLCLLNYSYAPPQANSSLLLNIEKIYKEIRPPGSIIKSYPEYYVFQDIFLHLCVCVRGGKGGRAEERMWVGDRMPQLSSCLPCFKPGSLTAWSLFTRLGSQRVPGSSSLCLPPWQ